MGKPMSREESNNGCRLENEEDRDNPRRTRLTSDDPIHSPILFRTVQNEL